MNDEVVTLLKLVGLILTAGFGIAGALYDFKNQTGQITAWGKRNLVGLAVGLLLSTVTLTGEYFVKRRSDRETARKTERLLAMATTALNPLNRINTQFSYSVPLDDRKFQPLRAKLARYPVDAGESASTSGYVFPDQTTDPDTYRYLHDGAALSVEIKRKSDGASISFEVSDRLGSRADEERQIYYQPHTNRLRVLAEPKPATAETFYVSEEPLAVSDLAGAQVTIALRKSQVTATPRPSRTPFVQALHPDMYAALEWVSLEFPGHLSISRGKEDFHAVAGVNVPTYTFTLPEKWEEIRREQ